MENVPSLYACICHHCSQPASSNHHTYLGASLSLSPKGVLGTQMGVLFPIAPLFKPVSWLRKFPNALKNS